MPKRQSTWQWLEPDSAEIRAIRGSEIALVFQEPMTSFSPHYTIGNQIVETIQLHQDVGKEEARNRTIELLRMVGIPNPERRIDEYPFELSGGLRQRVMIAMALSCNPTLLIADEPTTALDVTTQAQILDPAARDSGADANVGHYHHHDMGVIAEMADDVIVMYLGRVVESGPVDEIFPPAQTPVYAGAAALDSQHIRRAAQQPAYDRRLDSASAQSTDRLPIPSALRRRHARQMRPARTAHLRPISQAHFASCFLYHEPETGAPR